MTQDTMAEIAAGESYIIHPPINGKICIWVNCDKQMQVKLTTTDFRIAAQTLFKQYALTGLLKLLNQGETLYIDNTTCKPLRAKKIDRVCPIPMLKDVLNIKKKQQSHINLNF